MESNKYTQVGANGTWGIEGVDLSVLPPKVYRALYRLMQLEHPGIKMCPIRTQEGGRGR